MRCECHPRVSRVTQWLPNCISNSVFSGSCGALVCVGGTGGDEPDYTSGNVAWDSFEGETYLILVYGYSQRVGEFELSFSEVCICQSYRFVSVLMVSSLLGMC
jgi:hypothetical protein